MASERQNMSEQEISIKAREHELYVERLPTQNSKPVKPFPVYLRETPARTPFACHQSHTLDRGDRRGPALPGRVVAGLASHAPPSRQTGAARSAAKTAHRRSACTCSGIAAVHFAERSTGRADGIIVDSRRFDVPVSYGIEIDAE